MGVVDFRDYLRGSVSVSRVLGVCGLGFRSRKLAQSEGVTIAARFIMARVGTGSNQNHNRENHGHSAEYFLCADDVITCLVLHRKARGNFFQPPFRNGVRPTPWLPSLQLLL